MSFSGRTAEKLPSVLINGNARSHIWELRSQKWERSYIWVLMTIVPPTEIAIFQTSAIPMLLPFIIYYKLVNLIITFLIRIDSSKFFLYSPIAMEQ